MTIEELKNYLIERGIKGCQEAGHKPYEIKGAIEGFKECYHLQTPKDFEIILESLNKRSRKLFLEANSNIPEAIERYWRFRYKILQIEFVYERLKCAWRFPNLSARAVLDYSEILDKDGAM